MEDQLIHRTQFIVRGNDVGLHQICSPFGIIRMMHEAAMEHTRAHEISAIELVKAGKSWIVLNQYFEFIKDAYLGDQLKLITYPSGFDRIFTYRDYVALNERDEIVAKSCGRFIMMDLKERKMVKIPTEIAELVKDTKSLYGVDKPHRKKVNTDLDSFSKAFEVRFSDIDFNAHVSNQVYYKWIVDSFDLEFLKKNSLREIGLEFKEELGFEPEVVVQNYKESSLSYFHQIGLNKHAVSTGYSVWKNK